jgi:hypothetical protein
MDGLDGTEYEARPGQGEFIGTQLSSGSDREQRDDARRQYEEVLTPGDYVRWLTMKRSTAIGGWRRHSGTAH